LRPPIGLETPPDPYEALLSAATGPAEVLAVAADDPRFDAAAALRAMKRHEATSRVILVAFDAANRGQAQALQRAGATVAIEAPRTAEELPRALLTLLGLDAG
jgi:hypothetical protein